MAGFTDFSFRVLCRRYGCGLVLTELVNAQGIVHGSRRTLCLLASSALERPVGAHIYGSEPAAMAHAAATIQAMGRFDLIDINCGCPVRRIVAKGAGAALIADPAKIERIVSAVANAVTLPVTVKTRIGLTPGSDKLPDLANAVEQGGGKAIFVHARWASRRHSGPAEWEPLSRIKQRCSIPVVGNGGVQSPEDALAMLRETGVDGVMIGRASIGNPWLFDDMRHAMAGEPAPTHTAAEHVAVILEHFDRLTELREEESRYRRRLPKPAVQAAALLFRGHLVRYLSFFPGWRREVPDLGALRTREDIAQALDRVAAVH
jgi:tRNA-dihydrouridine synthase B